MDPEAMNSDEFLDAFMKTLRTNIENRLKEINEKVVGYCESYKSTRDKSYFQKIVDGTKEFLELIDGMKSICKPSEDLNIWMVAQKLILYRDCLNSMKSIRRFDADAEAICKIWEDVLKDFNIV